jgi:hypothetical protein
LGESDRGSFLGTIPAFLLMDREKLKDLRIVSVLAKIRKRAPPE